MNVYESAFEEALLIKGTDVIIQHRTPRLDAQGHPVKDKNENIVYDSIDIETICTMSEKQDYEKTDFGYTKAKTKSVVAKFRKKDAQYLNKKNRIIYTSQATGIEFEYTISDVIEEGGHMKVLLT
ncbi:MAG: hypothetical protein CVV28_02235 [Methanobacteriales archaeon HGW-Methanobacteriales-1]|jgi:hypothetical protein|nr:MAG: hypothetical protein CVV28_02235 [Methanobacteriales archaeon HGW-Methanobacteriales-1]